MSGVEVAPDAQAGRGEGAVARSLRILVVDDNKPFAETFAWMLEGAGDAVEIAHNGPNAVEIAARLEPDLVFMDIVLPVVDGYEVCKKLRARLRSPLLTIVALSGYGETADEAGKRGACFDAHFVKPVDLRQIVALLNDVRRKHLR